MSDDSPIAHLLVIITVGAVTAGLIAEFAKNDPNKKGGLFQRFNATFSWAIKNAFGS